MESTVEPLEGNKVKLVVNVDEKEFDKAIDAAFRKIAREVRIPGFRPGKAPRKVLEARFGKDIARGQALEDALPGYYLDAVREHEVDIIAAPEIDITAGKDEGPIQFDAVVEVRPIVTVAGYRNLRVTLDRPEPTDEEIDEQIDALRSRLSTLEPVDRPAIDTDVVTIDMTGKQGDEELSGLTLDDFAYEVGSGIIVSEVDEQLRGAKVGDILEFHAEHPSEEEDPIHFRLLVKEVKGKVLPDVDDEFAGEVSEFETVDELRSDLHDRLAKIKAARGGMRLRDEVGSALADLVEDDISEALIDAEVRQRLQELALRLAAQGLELGSWLEMSGRTQEDLLDELRDPAEKAARVDLALRAVAEAQEIEVTDDDLDEEYRAVAARMDVSPAEVRRRFERADEVQAVRSDLKKRKAFEWLLEQVEIVDPDGQPIDRSAFELSADEDDEHDENRSPGEPPNELPDGTSVDAHDDDEDDQDEDDE
jgi:trigger factor